MTELQIVPPPPPQPEGVTHVPSTPHKPIVVLTAVIGGTEQVWYVYGDDDEEVAHKLPRVHRYIQALRKRFGGDDTRSPASAPALSPSQPWMESGAGAGEESLHDCQWHGQMKRSTKVPGTQFCSHRMADGSFCKEKWPRRSGERSA